MKKGELQSIKNIILKGGYTITPHSYGASSMGYLVNYLLTFRDSEHEKAFNRCTYYICFSSKTWFKVKYEGVFYNLSYHAKYKQYDEEIESILYGDRVKLANRLVE